MDVPLFLFEIIQYICGKSSVQKYSVIEIFPEGHRGNKLMPQELMSCKQAPQKHG